MSVGIGDLERCAKVIAGHGQRRLRARSYPRLCKPPTPAVLGQPQAANASESRAHRPLRPVRRVFDRAALCRPHPAVRRVIGAREEAGWAMRIRPGS
jgi:hypothetical protein